MSAETGKIGKRGTVVIPAALRKRFGIKEGTIVIAEAHKDGILIRPAVALPVEIYSDEQKAAFILNNALPGDDYSKAREEVQKMGLNPDEIPHDIPDQDSSG